MSDGLSDNEEDPGVLWAEIHRLRAAVAGPAGYASWQDAAIAERVRRVKAEQALAAERERLCAAIKAADDKASEGDYMLDSDDCISVIRGTWKAPAGEKT